MSRQDEIDEFTLFMESNEPPPLHVETAILSKIRKELNPPLPLVVSKLFAFHVVGSLFTLILCPQYGLSLFGSLGVLPSFIMQIHPALCFFVCGVMWMIGGQSMTFAFLTIDEQRVLGHGRWATAFSITVLSVLLFACVGSLTLDLWFALWVFGAGSVILFFNWRATKRLSRLRAGLVLPW
jgi:hypothetical protein